MDAIPALDVAIGLIFVYFLLSIACSRFNEWVATKLDWRAKELANGIRSLLGEATTGPAAGSPLNAESLRTSAHVQSLTQAGRGWPSYIDGKTFARGVVSVLDPDASAQSLAAIETTIAGLPTSHPAKEPLSRLLVEAKGDLAQFREEIEEWFNSAMERVSGWYKRHVQKALFVYAVVITLILNVDSVLIARTLWTDESVRAAVVSQAEKADLPAEGGDQGSLDSIADDVSAVKRLMLPVGWTATSGDPRWPGTSFVAWLAKFVGLALTIGALSLGAPFWFDLLQKVSRLRNTGPRPGSDPG